MSSSVNAVQMDVEELNRVEAVRGDEVVEAVDDPTQEDLDRLETLAGGGDIVMRVPRDCSTYCACDCPGLCDGTCYYTHTCSDTQWCCC